MAGEEKTEKATPKKRRDSRKKGEVLQSKEVSNAVFVAGIFVFIAIFGQYLLQMLLNYSYRLFSELGSATGSIEFVMDTMWNIFIICLMTIGPVLGVGLILSILPVIVQTKGLFSAEAMKPKFSRLNPLSGIKRLFSIQSAVNILKGLIEIAIIGVILYFQISDRLVAFARLMDTDVITIIGFVSETAMSMIITIIVVLVFVAAADYVFQWWQFEKKLKMSKQEIKEEYKQTEGDPQIKGKIKRKQQEMAQRRMMSDVPTADVVIRNPTHLAIALKYDQAIAFKAPVVVAKGADALALRIVKVAEENGVFVTEDKQLARALYDVVEVGQEIPRDFYTAVAEVLALVYEAQGRKLEA